MDQRRGLVMTMVETGNFCLGGFVPEITLMNGIGQ